MITLRPFPRLRAVALKGARIYWRLRERYFQNYLFIHINKTAGRSIETALGCVYEHKTALQKRKEVGSDVWDRKFTFTFVRNPWDRVVSQYEYRHFSNQDHEQGDIPSFNAWVRRVYGKHDSESRSDNLLFRPQADWVTDERGNLMVDFVGRFERLEEDFRHVCDQIGAEASLPHKNKSSRDPYPTYYTEDTANIVARYFAEDIERFRYTF